MRRAYAITWTASTGVIGETSAVTWRDACRAMRDLLESDCLLVSVRYGDPIPESPACGNSGCPGRTDTDPSYQLF